MNEFIQPKEWTPPYVAEKGFGTCDFPACFCPPEARCKIWYEPERDASGRILNQLRPNGHNYMCRCQECTANETP